MEEKKNTKISLLSVFLIIIIIALFIGIIYLFLENQKQSKQISEYTNSTSQSMSETDSLSSQLSQKNKTIEKLEKEISNLKETKPVDFSDSANTYEITTIKNLNDVFSTSDTKVEKAQKVASEVMTAVNNKDWYYLAKIIGTGADDFVKYGINNFFINISDYQEYDGEYIFNESYNWDQSKLSSPKDMSLGNLLIIKFEDGGRIDVNANCTGI